MSLANENDSIQQQDTELDIQFQERANPRRWLRWLCLILLAVATGLVWLYQELERHNRFMATQLEWTQNRLRELQSQLHQSKPKQETVSKVKLRSDLPETYFDFRIEAQLKAWRLRRGQWQIDSGKLKVRPEDNFARAVISKVFVGDFEAEFEVFFDENGVNGFFGCSFFENSYGDGYRLEMDAGEGWARWTVRQNGERFILAARPISKEMAERQSLRLRVEMKEGMIKLWHEGRIFMVGFDARFTFGRLGLFSDRLLAFDNVRIRAHFDDRSEAISRVFTVFMDQHIRQFNLTNWAPISEKMWEAASGNGSGVSVKGNVLSLNSQNSKAWRLIGDRKWDRYMADMEVRTNSYVCLYIGGNENVSGYLIEFPATRDDSFHMHHLREGEDVKEVKAKEQRLRLSPGEWHRVRVFVSPKRVIANLDDVRIYDFFSFEFPEGKFGVYGWEGMAAEYRNIRVLLPAEEAKMLGAGEK